MIVCSASGTLLLKKMQPARQAPQPQTQSVIGIIRFCGYCHIIGRAKTLRKESEKAQTTTQSLKGSFGNSAVRRRSKRKLKKRHSFDLGQHYHYCRHMRRRAEWLYKFSPACVYAAVVVVLLKCKRMQ